MDLLSESTLKFCEYYLNGHEYYNAISAIFFFVIGLYIFFKRKTRIDIYFSIIITLIGLFTIALHYSATILGQILDFSSMYLITLWLITLNIESKFDFIKKHSLLFFIVIYLICVLVTFSPNFLLNIIVFGLTLVLSVLTLSLRVNVKDKKLELFLILGILLVGFLFWLADYFQIFCSEQLIFVNGHIIWHFAMATAYLFVWRFYRKILPTTQTI